MNVIAFPKTHFIAVRPAQRRRIEAIIEDLVKLLDFIDGDPDLEDDETEDENEHAGDVLDEPHDDACEAEPWLGWTEDRLDQTFPYCHRDEACTDREADDVDEFRD